jgi:hypothetical protein
MYFKLILKLVFIFIIIGCKSESNKLSKPLIEMNISMKNLNRLEFGNEYYKLKGIKTKINGVKSKIFKKNDNYIIESDSFIFDDYNSILLSNSLKDLNLSMHDLSIFKSKNYKVRFNDYQFNYFNFFPTFNLEYVEKQKARLSKIYSINKDFILNPIYFDFENYEKKDVLNEIKIYPKSIVELKKLINSNIYPLKEGAILLIHNPLTNIYSLYPDLSKFGKGESYINLNSLFDKLFVYQRPKFKSKPINILNDTIISSDIFLNNSKLNIYNNSRIMINNNANVYLDNVEINIKGNTKKINFISTGNSSIYISNSDNVKIENSNFKNFNNLSNKLLKLPSAITFYNSNVEIHNCTFSNNRFGDDYINFYGSEFLVNNSTFENILSDAIDSDFSNGKITNSKFINVGNDALDFSGSSVESSNNLFFKIGDKSISAGENSFLLSTNDIFNSCEIGIVSKDGSEVISFANTFTNNVLDYVVFKKKDFYKIPSLKIDHSLKKIKYLFEKNSDITTNDNENFVISNNVGDLLYGKKYGKASD